MQKDEDMIEYWLANDHNTKTSLIDGECASE
jgi:hypothetical protein